MVMKIWHGREYHERGEKQLTAYLDFYHAKTGYLLSFNFNKHKKSGFGISLWEIKGSWKRWFKRRAGRA